MSGGLVRGDGRGHRSRLGGRRAARGLCLECRGQFCAVIDHARNVGGRELRGLTFHQRAELISASRSISTSRKEPFYELAYETGATRKDNFVDIDGGIMTCLPTHRKAGASCPMRAFRARRCSGTALEGRHVCGRHIITPLRGVAVHINAYNFPCWGMLEKLAPAIMAGVPAIVKPATATAYIAHAVFEEIVASGILPEGACNSSPAASAIYSIISTGQDVMSFTGSAKPRASCKRTPGVRTNSVRFIAEQDSLNAAILGPTSASMHRSSIVCQRSSARDHDQSGTAMHVHPARHRAPRE